jgi:methyl-accepting chemotaxis protein
MGFNRMKLDTKLVGSSILVAVLMILFFAQFLTLIRSSVKGLSEVVRAGEAMRLAQDIDTNFQLAVSKGKNVAILKDQKNRERTLLYLKQAFDAFGELQKLETETDEQDYLKKLGAGLASVAPKLQTLVQEAKDTDKAEELYAAHLKDITIDFDNASDAYITFLGKKVQQTQTDLGGSIAIGRMVGILLVVLTLGGILLNLSISLGVAKTLRTLTRNLIESADQVTTASVLTSSSSQQLAEGAGESASSLEETSSSLEEMASMTRQNAENAVRANRMMEDTRQMVLQGNSAVEETVRSMKVTNDSAEKISKIIKTIEEIAFQTNLLALNAAVEAARAGEHGKGFAVVAEEVRNLAHRSATAAKDTAALIEENAKRVGTGVKVSEEAGRTLSEIVERAKKVSDLISEIASASQEQSKGIEEINGAVAQMDKVTQRNTSNAEELASSSEELSSQAQALRDMVVQLAVLPEGNQDARTVAAQAVPKAAGPAHPILHAPHFQPTVKPSGNGNGKLKNYQKKFAMASVKTTTPEEVIPLGQDELKDF